MSHPKGSVHLSQRLRSGRVFSTSGYDGFGRLEYSYIPSSADTYYTDSVDFGGQYGYYYDQETGLSLLTHRYYDPQNGRFLTRDPIGYGGGLNLYSLATYNPVNKSDPSGTTIDTTALSASQLTDYNSAIEHLKTFPLAKAEFTDFSQLILGTSTFFRHVNVVPVERRERLLDNISRCQFAIGITASPEFSEEERHFDMIFEIAKSLDGLIFNGSGMVDADGLLVLDNEGNFDVN